MPFLLEPGKRFDQVGNLRSYRPETLVVWHEEGHAFYFRMSGRHQKRWMNALAEYAQAGNKHVNDFDAAELFADAYMLYRADPEELRRLSPHIYDVFNKQPKQMKKTMDDVIANTQVEYVSKYDMKNGKGQSTSPEDMHVAWNVKDRSGMDPDEIKVNSSSPTEFTSAIIHERADKAGLFDNQEAMDLERLNWESIDPLDMARRAASRGASREQALAELQTYYLPQWYRALVHWHSYSAVGKEVLEMISAGRQTDDMVAFVYDFLRKNREGIAARLGLRGEEEILDHAQLAVNEIVKTTMGDRQIADVALNNPENLQAILSEKVANLDPKLLPVVNGQLPQQIEGKGPAFLSGIAKKYTETLFATTTNKMSRQPYYKYRRARHERALMGNQLVNGGSWTPSVERAVKMASRENAIADTWELLFDARRQNRLSEMVRFIMPFAQPWSEALVVWSRMLQKNPEFALHLYQIGRTMKDHGVVRQDRMGEWVIKVPFVGDWMATLGNWILPGQIKETNDHFNLVFPLQSFNFMLSSTVNVDGLPVPVPSTWAPATWFAQKLSENDHLPEGLKTMLAEYSYQYGSVQNGGGMVRALLPSWMGSFLSSIGAIGSQKDLYTQDFLQIMEMNGITGISLVEDREMALAMAGRVFNNVEEANIWLIEEAGQKAESFGLMRTFFGSIFPAPPILQMPIYEAQEYLDELKKQYPDDFDVVREKFIEKYPDLKMVAIAATMWDRPDISPVSLPPSSAVAKLFESGAADELMSINPAFLFALLPEEAWEQEFDRIEWMRQIDAGWRRVKTPEEFIASYETSEGWRHFFYATQMRDSKLAALQAQGISSSDPQWDATIEEYDNAIDYMKVLFPAWANDFTPGVEKPATIIANISQALEIPEFANTQVGQGLADYMEFRNGIGNQLEALNISSLDNSVAESLGIKQEYDTYVDGLKEDYGDTFQIFFDRFLGDDLTESYLLTRGEKVLHALSQDVELWNRSIDEQDQWNVLQDRIKDFEPGTDPDYTAVAQLYQEQRNISNDWWKKYGATVDNAQWAWWETRSYSEKQDYLLAIASRPYQYLSRFDKEVILGLTTDDLTEEQWANVNYISANAAIANEVNPAGRDAGYWYERADRLAGEYAAANTGFGRELALANTWGYTFFTATGYGGKGTASDPAWRSVQNLVQRYQQFAEAWKMGDDNNYDGFLRRMYIGLRTDLLTAMDNLAQSNPMFAKEYQEMRENYPSFIDVLIPETYYRLG